MRFVDFLFFSVWPILLFPCFMKIIILPRQIRVTLFICPCPLFFSSSLSHALSLSQGLSLSLSQNSLSHTLTHSLSLSLTHTPCLSQQVVVGTGTRWQQRYAVLTEEKLALSSFKGSLHGTNSLPQDYPVSLEMIRCVCVCVLCVSVSVSESVSVVSVCVCLCLYLYQVCMLLLCSHECVE